MSDLAEVSHRTISTNGIDMHVAELGEGIPVVMCHGFPGLWFNWRRQMPAVAAAGWRAVAPDLRGFGRTDAPASAETYDRDNTTADITGLIDELGAEQVVLLGHDFGGPLVWDLSMRIPERVLGTIVLSQAYRGHPPQRPSERNAAVSDGVFHHLHYFQTPGVADAELNSNPRLLLAGMFWALSGGHDYVSWEHSYARLKGRRQVRGGTYPSEGFGYLEALPDPPNLPWSWLDSDDFEYYVAEFTRTGFTGGLNWYRAMDRTWEQTARYADKKVETPSCFIAGTDDVALRMHPAWLEEMHEHVLDLRRILMVPDGGHYVQMECPEEVNRGILEFLSLFA